MSSLKINLLGHRFYSTISAICWSVSEISVLAGLGHEIAALVADCLPFFKKAALFFQTIQSKLHVVCIGYTVAEFIHQRGEASQSHMWLSNYK
ncbi:hypothetical protein D3C73_248290 [compost metagenome]